MLGFGHSMYVTSGPSDQKALLKEWNKKTQLTNAIRQADVVTALTLLAIVQWPNANITITSCVVFFQWRLPSQHILPTQTTTRTNDGHQDTTAATASAASKQRANKRGQEASESLSLSLSLSIS